MPCSRFFNVANVSFNAIRENKILVKISEFTVCKIALSNSISSAILLFSVALIVYVCGLWDCFTSIVFNLVFCGSSSQ